jgi:hypothetical protein
MKNLSRGARTTLRTALILGASGLLVWAGGAAPALAAYSPPSVVMCKNSPNSNAGLAVGQFSAPVPAGLCMPVGGYSAPGAIPGVPPFQP